MIRSFIQTREICRQTEIGGGFPNQRRNLADAIGHSARLLRSFQLATIHRRVYFGASAFLFFSAGVAIYSHPNVASIAEIEGMVSFVPLGLGELRSAGLRVPRFKPKKTVRLEEFGHFPVAICHRFMLLSKERFARRLNVRRTTPCFGIEAYGSRF